MNKKQTSLITLALLTFYLTWGIPQLLTLKLNNDLLPDFLFSIVFTGIAGCLIPIILKNKFDYTYAQKSPRRLLGLLLLVLTIVFGTVGSGAFLEAIEVNYSFLTFLKYILLFIPMALAISLFAFLLIPNLIDKSNIKLKNLTTVVSIGLFFFVGFLVDTVFKDIELAGIMGVLGVLFGLSYVLIRNFWFVSVGFFLTLLTNTLAENKYDEYSYWIVIISTLMSIVIIVFDLLKNREKTLHNNV